MKPALLIATCAWLAACASTSPQCVDDVSACIARCENATGPDRDPDVDERPQRQIKSECETRCRCSRKGGNKPKLKPTPTGM